MEEFRKLWIGQTISAIGSSVTLVALPLTAAFTLSATPEQMGFLVAVGWVPYLLFGLFAGAWSDRLPRKPILIACDVGRAAVLLTIPLAAVMARLGIELLLAVAFVAAALTVLFQSAYRPFIPVLVGRDALIDANAKLALSESVARVAGPSLGGLLVQVLTAPFAVLADAASFVVSVIAIASVRVVEAVPPRQIRRSVWNEIAEGIRVVVDHPFVRSMTLIVLIFNVASVMGDAVYILYATRVLGLDGALVGIVFGIGGVASIVGATAVRRVAARFGIGRSMAGAVSLFAVAGTLALAASGPPLVASGYLAVRSMLIGVAVVMFNVMSASIYQGAVPNRLQGRVGGAGQVLALGLNPIAAVAGGWARRSRRPMEHACDLGGRTAARSRLRPRRVSAATNSLGRRFRIRRGPIALGGVQFACASIVAAGVLRCFPRWGSNETWRPACESQRVGWSRPDRGGLRPSMLPPVGSNET